MTQRIPFRYALCGLVLCLASVLVSAQTTTTSTLVVSMTVQSSISLEFVNGSGAGSQGTCTITGANTSTASINFGIASIAGDNQSCVSFSKTPGPAGNYTLSNNVYALVTQSNLTSSSFTLTASLGSAPPTGVSWQINSAALSTGLTSLTSGGTYGSNYSMYLQVTVSNNAATGNIGETINFTATAN